MIVWIREMYINMRRFIFWCVILLALIAVGMGLYAGLTGYETQIDELLSGSFLPFGVIIGADKITLSDAVGYYSVIYNVLLIVAATFAIMFGSGIISKDEREYTAEYLLTKPLNRSMLVISKLSVVIIYLLALNAVCYFAGLTGIRYFEPDASIDSILYNLGICMFLVSLVYAGFGIMLASVIKIPEVSAGLSVVVLVFTFLVHCLVNFNGDYEFLKILSPFSYFNAQSILSGSKPDIFFISLCIGMFVIYTGVAMVVYANRDIRVQNT